ncbi:MAG: malate synthase A, partial [Actinomycetes bacterium]
MDAGRIDVVGPAVPRGDTVLTPAALEFVTHLHARFAPARAELLAARARRRASLGNGCDLRPRPAMPAVRHDPTWRVAGPGPGLTDRRVEFVGPADQATAHAALGSGASTWVADLEDSTSPTWHNVVTGHVVLADVVRQWPTGTGPDAPPTLIMRPRGWHLVEKHLCHTDRTGRTTAASASLVDFGLFVFANAADLAARGQGPYVYLPKLESAAEARLWDQVFTETERVLGLPHKTIRATVLIETITAALEMEEILYELRHHCAGLNAGRWDYLFSIIKKFHDRGPSWTLPDRAALTMTTPLMQAYTRLLVSACHRRGAQAIGPQSTAILDDQDAEASERAAEVAAEKRREAEQGFDGTWVAHPGLVDIARSAF